ncbi:geminin coiled-coil domain-containing protein 1, partial [Lampetra fluviatilis]
PVTPATPGLAWPRVLQILGLKDPDTIDAGGEGVSAGYGTGGKPPLLSPPSSPPPPPCSPPPPPCSPLPAFYTAVRHHSTVKTRSFSHGQTFTARDESGGWRFTWVPRAGP